MHISDIYLYIEYIFMFMCMEGGYYEDNKKTVVSTFSFTRLRVILEIEKKGA